MKKRFWHQYSLTVMSERAPKKTRFFGKTFQKRLKTSFWAVFSTTCLRRRKSDQNRIFIAICLDFFPRENLDPLLITMKSIFGRFLFFRFDKLTKQMVLLVIKRQKSCCHLIIHLFLVSSFFTK